MYAKSFICLRVVLICLEVFSSGDWVDSFSFGGSEIFSRYKGVMGVALLLGIFLAVVCTLFILDPGLLGPGI